MSYIPEMQLMSTSIDSYDNNEVQSPISPKSIVSYQSYDCVIGLLDSTLKRKDSNNTGSSVKSCKHCGFKFRPNYSNFVDFCTKDCQTCHNWFTKKNDENNQQQQQLQQQLQQQQQQQQQQLFQQQKQQQQQQQQQQLNNQKLQNDFDGGTTTEDEDTDDDIDKGSIYTWRSRPGFKL